MQLDNIANVLKYQFIPYPNADGSGVSENMNISALRSNSKAALQLTLSSGKWTGSHYPQSHLYRQSTSNSNSAGKAFSPSVSWSNAATSTVADKMEASKGFQFNIGKAVQQNISYKVLNPWLLLSCLDVEPVINSTLINAAKDHMMV